MKNAPTTKSNESALEQADSSKQMQSQGVQNPKEQRALKTRMCTPVSCEHLDKVAEFNHNAEVVWRLRSMGLDLPCSWKESVDRGGNKVTYPVYSLSEKDRFVIRNWHRSGNG